MQGLDLKFSDYACRDIIARLPAIGSNERKVAMTQMLNHLNQLRALDSSFVDMLSAVDFVPTQSGDLRSPAQLYDPRRVTFSA